MFIKLNYQILFIIIYLIIIFVIIFNWENSIILKIKKQPHVYFEFITFYRNTIQTLIIESQTSHNKNKASRSRLSVCLFTSRRSRLLSLPTAGVCVQVACFGGACSASHRACYPSWTADTTIGPRVPACS